jgi:protein phosphatase
MLVCPNCQFENPNTNKFCQECGTALTQNTCPNCGSMAPFDALHCQECGAIAGVVWWAVIVEDPTLSQGSGEAWALTPTAHNGNQTGTDSYLDQQHRYQLLEFLPPIEPGMRERQVRVLDCQPFQLSLLEALAHKVSEFSEVEIAHAGDEGGVAGAASGVRSLQSLAVPSIAQPYLAFRSSLVPAVPAIHDAWQQDGQQIILLEDRSELPLLLDLWRDEEFSLLPLQLLHWLYDMVELWEALEPWHCQRSLLELTNLRVDGDQTFCLQRLYSDADMEPLTLQDLGQLWQMLFAESQRTHFGAISQLLADLDAGVLTASPMLRSRLEAIAHELHPAGEPLASADAVTAIELPKTLPPQAAPMPVHPLLQAEIITNRLEVADADERGEENDNDNDPTVVLPMQLFALDEVGRTDIGRQRQHNEDYFGIETQVMKLENPSGKTVRARNLYILCDGMGGQADGEVASAMAVETLRKFFREKWQDGAFPDGHSSLPGVEVMNEAIQLANKCIYDVNQQNARSGSGRMGTTLVMLLLQDTEVMIAHVGDSRLYRYTRKRGLEQITVDHEVGQREIQRGVSPEQAYARPDAYQLTQALGPRDEHFVKPDIQPLEINEDALFLLCSDGLTDNDLLETYCQSHVEPLLSSQANLEAGVTQLIELANKYNGHDNITAIVIRAKVRPNLTHIR